jgi:hypothetical protein
MMRYGKFALIGLAISFSVACGSDKLTSVSVTPATADAQNYPGGVVQFSATGMFSNSSKPTPLTNVTWCVGTTGGMCNGNIASAASVDGRGRAQCLGGMTGTVTVLAGTGGTVSNPDGGRQLSVFGSAQLRCP